MSNSSSSTTRCMKFSIDEIKAATNQFDRSKILGQGGEAKVYFAEIYIGSIKTPVAVKHLEDNSKEFEREIKTLSEIQHPNLVSLIGYCDDLGYKILIYEYMSKGCLSDYLKDKSCSISLSWMQRLNICLDVARGLQQLHTESDAFPKGIIHRDVKPGNVLVGENWVAKLSDFGMFKLSTVGQDKSLMIASLKGTCGYYAPEYIENHCITRKIDVYSFGVVLFQVLCRKMPWDRGDESYYAREEDDLGFWAHQNVDAQIQGEISRDSLLIFTDIIRRSLQANPDRRPTMDSVVLDLEKVLEYQETGRRLDMDGVVQDQQSTLDCQEYEKLTKQLDGFVELLPKSQVRFTLDRSPSLTLETRDEGDNCLIEDDIGDADEINPSMMLMYLASEGDLEGLNELLDSGVDVNFRNIDNRTSLHLAACQGFSDVAELLLQYGAEVDPEDRWGSTPLAEAIHNKNHEVIKHLERYGAKPLNTREVREYEVDPRELYFTNRVNITEGTFRIASWNGIKVAVKMFGDDVFNDDGKVRAFRDELALLQRLRHPNVVQFLAAVTQCSPLMIVTEYLPRVCL